MVVEEIIEHPFLINLAKDKSPLPKAAIAQAMEVIATTPAPTTRTEAWKYTRVAKLTRKEYTQARATIQSIDNYSIDSEALNLVFVNGMYQKQLSSSETLNGVTIKSIQECTSEELMKAGNNVVLENELFNAINTVYAQDGIYIEVAAGTVVDKTIQIIHVSTGEQSISHQRNIFVANASSNVSIIQAFFSENAGESFANHITEVKVGANAQLKIDKIQAEGDSSNQVITEQVEQANDSTFTINTLTFNGALVRNNLNIAVNGKNCETNLNGAYLLKGNQHVDNHTVVDHKIEHCNSNELYKGIIDDKATAVFNGKVFVRKDAQIINAFQSNGNVLLSDDATVNSKPELEIYADDVKCSHGSTTGQLDEEAVFYLRARGLSEKAARQLMVGAFVGEVFEKVENEAVSKFINKILTDRFGWIIED